MLVLKPTVPSARPQSAPEPWAADQVKPVLPLLSLSPPLQCSPPQNSRCFTESFVRAGGLGPSFNYTCTHPGWQSAQSPQVFKAAAVCHNSPETASNRKTRCNTLLLFPPWDFSAYILIHLYIYINMKQFGAQGEREKKLQTDKLSGSNVERYRVGGQRRKIKRQRK